MKAKGFANESVPHRLPDIQGGPKMGIIRTALRFETNFTQVPNAWVRDERLTRRARGLLVEVASHQAGWRITVKSLCSSGPEGKDSIRSAMNELIEYGYLTRAQDRYQSGRFGEIEYALQDPNDPGFDGDENDEDQIVETRSQTPDNGGLVAENPPTVGGSTVNDESATKNTISKEHYSFRESDDPPAKEKAKDEAKPKSKPQRKKPATVIPDDWHPSPACISFADENRIDIKQEAEKFTNHALANDRRQVNWDASFRLWLGNAKSWAGERRAPVATQSTKVAPDWWMR